MTNEFFVGLARDGLTRRSTQQVHNACGFESLDSLRRATILVSDPQEILLIYLWRYSLEKQIPEDARRAIAAVIKEITSALTPQKHLEIFDYLCNQ